MTFYTFENSELSDANQVNANFNKTFKLQSEKAINDVSATNSGVLAVSSQVLIDKFLDSNGQNNTVDTGAGTTAEYSSSQYICNKLSSPNPIGEPSFETVTGWTYSETDADFDGGQSNTWATNGTYSYKLFTAGGSIAQNAYNQITRNADFTGIDNIKIDYNYVVDTSYNVWTTKILIDTTEVYSGEITAGGGAGTYTGTFALTGLAYTGTHSITIRQIRTGAAGGGVVALYVDNIRCYKTTYNDSIIQSVATTIPTGMTKCFITPLMYESLATGDSITADVSIDNGAHYTTGVPINTWTPITSANGTQLIVKANLLTGSGATTPKVLGWRVLME